MSALILGLDLSVNHLGFVVMQLDGELCLSGYVTNVRGELDPELAGPWGTRVSEAMIGLRSKIKGAGSKETYGALRVQLWRYASQSFGSSVLHHDGVTHVALEDYATSGQSNSIYQLGEVSALFRTAILRSSGSPCLRLLSPTTVKKWAGHGFATKMEMRAAMVREGYEVPDKLFKPTKLKRSGLQVPELAGPGTDIVDAYWLAEVTRVELLLRSGAMVMGDLSPKRIEVMNSVSKSKPENLLTRPFIQEPSWLVGLLAVE